MTIEATFRETHDVSTPIRDLGLTIEGTPLQPVVDEFLAEVDKLGVAVRPRPYLSTEWGVPFGTVAIAIPFYLASPELTALHEERTAFVEGTDRADVLRYLRHEMGHVVNYAYQLYERPEWVDLFGPIGRPYREKYRPKPFSRKYVRHLPGWYAQKHPDEDWAETFAVWMTPRLDWKREYEAWSGALAKLEYCDRTLKELRSEVPAVTDEDLDEDVATVGHSLRDFYGDVDADGGGEPLPGLDGALRTLFEESGHGAEDPRPATALIEGLGRTLPADVYRWTGHFPEHTRALLAQMRRRAEELQLVYPSTREQRVERAAVVLVTALAMSHVQTGSYLP
jgi:Putative zinc-binding metallo-peptidase